MHCGLLLHLGPLGSWLAYVAVEGWANGFLSTAVAGLPIPAALARDGAYHSQYATGAGNGGFTVHSGGDRARCESRIIGGAYDDAPPRGSARCTTP
ncbi:DUF3626 domain-containing protein [Streptomyces broussonetiae]|uniref:DUF3626 domain-containing protein n=1 Tax=Streptomyces broussonetiae TaxID=2686304 RepID=UPI002D8086F5|nr:DUF3626 domain-containing protein [Streptomyces broussonetiae]